MGCVQRSSVNETTARVKAWTYTILTPTVLCPTFTCYRNNSRVEVWTHTTPFTSTVMCRTFTCYRNNSRVEVWTHTTPFTSTVMCRTFTCYWNNSRVMVWLHPRSCSVQRSLTTAIIAESRFEPTQPAVTAMVVCPTFVSYWNNSRVRVWVSELSLKSTETTRLIKDGEKGGSGYGGGGRRLYTYRYTVTTRMTPALRWAVMMRAILIFH